MPNLVRAIHFNQSFLKTAYRAKQCERGNSTRLL